MHIINNNNNNNNDNIYILLQLLYKFKDKYIDD